MECAFINHLHPWGKSSFSFPPSPSVLCKELVECAFVNILHPWGKEGGREGVKEEESQRSAGIVYRSDL